MLALSGLILSLANCSHSVPKDAASLGKYLENPANGLLITQEQGPYVLTAKYLPSAYLTALEQPTAGAPQASPAGTSSVPVAIFKLRVASKNPTSSVQGLLRETVTLLTPDEQQHALFYQMQQAGYLQVGSQRVRPIAAYVEMTPQREQYLDIVFTFSLHDAPLPAASEVTFVLDKAFFLAYPVRFAFAAENIQAVAS
ncbi:hypothetical protein J0X19_24465 [Hymenobacter sp. BT186]|uniref:Uncharacterized protein n=1 Tax=Hymenobacter telluris TaxID=2816474 RepID=A0A939JF57_9BACT|nr:hypothetical protein [Hymenobacter telluris]MBO0361135.1 hypothetical protein [Hymenobacter telluris]MBW3377163.1 hypothetical protein [Hymenobacter norwichensis]